MVRRRNSRSKVRSAGRRSAATERAVRSRRIWGGLVAAAVGAAALWALWNPSEPAGPMRGEHTAPAAERASGQALYAAHCASCHGAELEGQPNWREPLPNGSYPAPPHDETGHTWHHPDAYLFAVTKRGGQAFTPPGVPSGMPAFEGVLSDAEIRLVLDFIRSRWPPEIRERQRRTSSSR